MDSLLNLPVATGSAARILQITDPHLFASKDQTLLGVNTWQSFQAVLGAIRAQAWHCDLIVATGDLVQDQTAEAYQHFAQAIAELPAPCVWLPGNHDEQQAMGYELTKAGLSTAKQILLGDAWQLVMLDSQLPGVPHGELSEYQLNWLEAALARYPERYTLVSLHHHPHPSGCSWLDQHSLRNAPMLAALLESYPKAHTLLCGHIHQSLDVNWQGRRLLASPSTCIQFKPHCSQFTIDTESPGWRWVELHSDGRLETRVERLQTRAFCPDPDAEGY
ncbi:MAG: 3',5'-cyclic adenosine monophosphate phosphodiesterase CpdA [Candidatus Erwinia impunctatus]|nr:3',5'-cyclic adenosine monophosphate phosphodiesterase CpdA [Culicoides impunctatus]